MAEIAGFPESSGEEDLLHNARELVGLLVRVGANPHTARALICLHVHGPSTSSQLQNRCDMRQPDVSIAIRQLKQMGLVSIEYSNHGSRGRPSHIYELAVPLREALAPFRSIAIERLSILQDQLSRLSELTDAVTIE